MHNKKIIIIEFGIILLLWATVFIMLMTTLGHIAILNGIILAGLLGIMYISTLSWYICIDKMPLSIIKLILIQILPLALTCFLFDTITALIIGLVLVIGIQILFKTINDIKESSVDHIKFRIKTIILPHTKGIVVWLMLLSSVFIYGNTLKTNPRGIFLAESFLSNQIQAWMPLLNQVAPNFNPNISVGNYISEQIDSQNLNLNNINRDEIIKQQVDELGRKFELNLTSNTPITQALVNYGNKFLTPWMSGPIWGAIVSFSLFFTFLPFVGILQFSIRIMISIIHTNTIKSKFINFSKQNIEKETLSF
jgi:hypothetical protein